jgi:Domain of unknown function (DUF4386)
MRAALMLPPLEPAQRFAAKLAGLLYLLQMATGVFGFWAKGQVIAPGDAAQTALNLAASERLFRLGVASDLLTAVIVIALVVALYVVLQPVNRSVALLAACWRLAENAIAAAAVLNAFVALRLLSGVSYLRDLDSAQLQALARMFLGIQGQGLRIAFVFLGLGSAAFSYLWLRSRYIPRALAVWGIFASLVLASFTLAIMVFPGLGDVLSLTYMAPMGIYEVTLGTWLLAKGIRAPRVQ